MYQTLIKPFFDFLAALLLLILVAPILVVVGLVLLILHRSSPIFMQKRVGKQARLFTIYKFKTMDNEGKSTSFLHFLRRSKIDELPQLVNILKGEMSFVGPRPDVEGYYDQLMGENRKILQLKPGITGRASLKYANEEALLSQQSNPLAYNDQVIFPDKVAINLTYLKCISFKEDISILLKTILLFHKN